MKKSRQYQVMTAHKQAMIIYKQLPQDQKWAIIDALWELSHEELAASCPNLATVGAGRVAGAATRSGRGTR
jgi:hypothetical protein